ncbi:MAG TPA: polysaccharide deacetylase family protein [Pyrinomonadaceae bacterium]|nr:polysaccharide deacetylase family protein [Pyrinomonadaceae bacterium]
MKKRVLSAAKRMGGLNLLSSSSWRRDRLLILGYHGLALDDEHLWNPSLFMPADLFRRRIEFMLDFGCNILPLGEALDLRAAGKLPEKAVAITFDDGFFNFYSSAVPILKEYDLPSSVYVTTYYSTYNRPVFGIAVDYLLWKARAKAVEIELEGCVSGMYDLSDPEVRANLHDRIWKHVENEDYSAKAKNDLIDKLCQAIGVDFTKFCAQRLFNLMTTDELKNISDQGIGVEMHTHRHRMPRDRKLFDREIVDNRQVIVDSTGKMPSHFCYPSGNYDRMFFSWLKKNGIRSATTCDSGLVSRSTNMMQIPRLIDTATLSEIEFEGWITGAASLLPRRKLVRINVPAVMNLIPLTQLDEVAAFMH